MQPAYLHEAAKPISWLLGKWRSISAKGEYPTIKPFKYCEELVFSSVGQPMLNYWSIAWHPDSKLPMHQERGFLRIKPGSNNLSFLVAYNLGISSLEDGFVEGDVINLKSSDILRMSFVKDPAVTCIARNIKVDRQSGNLEMVVSMATVTTKKLAKHTHVIYKKIG